jgi:hypothetical protein
MTKTAKPDPKKAHAVAQREYYARMREAGMTRVSNWIPMSAKADFEDRLEKLRRQWRKEGLIE